MDGGHWVFEANVDGQYHLAIRQQFQKGTPEDAAFGELCHWLYTNAAVN